MATKKKPSKKAKSRKVRFPNITISSKALFYLASREVPAHFRRKMALLIYGALPERSKIFFLNDALSKVNRGSRTRLVLKYCPKKKK